MQHAARPQISLLFNAFFSIYCYDLTTDQKAFDSTFHPTPKVGHYKINAHFSDDITAPISMIIVTEHDSKIQYKNTGEVIKSYVA